MTGGGAREGVRENEMRARVHKETMGMRDNKDCGVSLRRWTRSEMLT